jgi:uncharacterized protein
VNVNPNRPLVFEEEKVLCRLRHYLPAQAPLKDFIHHNTLHAFQHLPWEEALLQARDVFGYKVQLSLAEYRKLYANGKIHDSVLTKIIQKQKKRPPSEYKQWLLHGKMPRHLSPRIGELRSLWKKKYRVDLNSLVHPLLFRTLCSYLDQGIAIWNFPIWNKGFLSAIREMERMSYSSFFKNKRARNLLLEGHVEVKQLLTILVGNEELFERYIFDQQFAHPGWSGMIATIEEHPETLLDQRSISLMELVIFEMLLEIDALDTHLGSDWQPLQSNIDRVPVSLFSPLHPTEEDNALHIFQEAFEWSYYDQAIMGMQHKKAIKPHVGNVSFQSLFCIDDRECSLRRHIETTDANAETYGTPGFFGVEFYFQPADGKFFTKLCPAPVTPKYLIKELAHAKKREKDPHFAPHSHSLWRGWLISQTLGFWSAAKLFGNIFKPSMSPATASSFRHMDKVATLTIENVGPLDKEGELQVGFTVEEMAVRVENLLRSIGLIQHFAPIVYVVGHGSSSVNNPHYAAYDCGACSGRAGSVNARVISHMANHPGVRALLQERGIDIPQSTRFIGGLHDTTRDEIEFFDDLRLSPEWSKMHRLHQGTFHKALHLNARERSRRFGSIPSDRNAAKVHEQVKLRSVSLFEPRPELNHATNALCIVGRRELSRGIFLDRRSFLNSFDYRTDPEGRYLYTILKAAAPVCGGINLEYFFSRVDNQKLGAGTKLPHNVMGLFGVANGIEGDLRPGLPSQMIEVHDPVRLLIVVEHFPDVVLRSIQKDAATYEWFKNSWVHLIALHPQTKEAFRFGNEKFMPYQPATELPERIENLDNVLLHTPENLPVFLIES